MANILIFDTSTEMFSVALKVKGNVFSFQQIAPRQHTQLLLPIIDKLLEEAGISLAEINVLAFGQGPGSFIGLRIAASAVQGLALGQHIPVVAVPTLQLLAQQAYVLTGRCRIAAAIDARMAEVYWNIFALDNNQLMQPLQADQLCGCEQIIFPADSDRDKFFLAGNGWGCTPYRSEENKGETVFPVAAAGIAIAEQLWKEGKTLSATEIEPLYLRNNVTS